MKITFTLPKAEEGKKGYKGNEVLHGRQFEGGKHVMVVPDSDSTYGKVVDVMKKFYGCKVKIEASEGEPVTEAAAAGEKEIKAS
jgi:hypothetical protein